MELFIGNLPAIATENDLVGFFRGFNKKVQFRFEQKKLPDGSKVRYAVATYESEKLAQKAMEKLNGQPLHGNPLVIREYYYRSYNNEQRAVGWRNRAWHGVERRNTDRRNHEAYQAEDEFAKILKGAPKEEAEPKKQNIVIEAYRNFARKF